MVSLQRRWKVRKIGGAFVSNWENQKIGSARIVCVLIKLLKVGGARA